MSFHRLFDGSEAQSLPTETSLIALTLPFPPSVNNYWGQRGNMKFIKARGKAFRLSVAEIVAEKGQTIEGRLRAYVALFPPTSRKFDIDNNLKSLFDALQHAGLFEDDEQIDHIVVRRCDKFKGGMCKVVVTRYE